MVDAKQAQGFLSFFKRLPSVSNSFSFLSEIWSYIVLQLYWKNGWQYLSSFYLQDPRAVRFFDRRVSAPFVPLLEVCFFVCVFVSK